jgi:hypothetical protein
VAQPDAEPVEDLGERGPVIHELQIAQYLRVPPNSVVVRHRFFLPAEVARPHPVGQLGEPVLQERKAFGESSGLHQQVDVIQEVGEQRSLDLPDRRTVVLTG